MTIQGNLFQRQPTEEDRLKDFLKSLFATIEGTWGFHVIEEGYEEYRIQKEMEEEFEKAAEEEIQEDDF